jgi:phage-related protein
MVDYGEASEDKGTKEQEAIFAMMQEWEDKLFQQKLEHYEAEKEFELSAMEENNATQEELYKRNKYYTDLILNMKLEALEKEKQAKLDAVADDEEHAEIRASIEQYYQNQANEMQKDAYKEKAKYLKKDEEETETAWSKFKNGVSTVSKYMVNAFKSAYSAVSNLFSKIGKIISGVWSGFVKALDFNPDETLDRLLAFEDKILTFFYDTLPQLPSFLANALQSIGTLLNTLLENIDFSGLAEMLADALGNAVDILPSLIQGVIKIVGEIVKQLPSIIKKVMPKIVSALKTIVKALPQILPEIIKGVFGMINGIAQSLPEMLPEIMNGIFELIKALITELPTTVDLLLTGIANALQELVSNPDKIAEFIHVIMEAMGNIARSLLENAGVIFGALIEILPDVLMKILVDLPSILGKIFEGAWNGVIAVLKGTVNALIKGVNFITQGLSMAWTWLGIPAIPKIPLLAKGTDNAQRGLAIVGEAGPELVNFRGGEQVLSNKKTNEALSGNKTNNFNVTFNNVSDTSAYALVQQLKRYNRELAFNGVL